MIQNIILPKQGLQMTEGFITRWILKEGDLVTEGQPLFEMETDKLVITIDATCSGKLLKILYPEGSTVPITTVIAYVGEEGDAIPESAPAPVPAQPDVVPVSAPAPVKVIESQQTPVQNDGRIFATPRARTVAEKNGYDLRDIAASGPEGLIIERDVLSFVPSIPDAGKMSAAAMPCILSAQISVFSDEQMSAETAVRLAYAKAAGRTGICTTEELTVRVIQNATLTSCILPCEGPQVTVCANTVTLAFYPGDAEADSIIEFFELFCLFAQKPWLAAVK